MREPIHLNVVLPDGRSISGDLRELMPRTDDPTSALMELSGMFCWINQLAVMAGYYYDVARARGKQVAAQRELEHRRTLDGKITEAVVKANVECDPIVVASVNDELNAKRDRDALNAASESLAKALDTLREISCNRRAELRNLNA